MNSVKVTIVTTVYNGEKYAHKYVEMIKTIDYGNIEVIVVDDGSTDNTYSILSRYNLNVMRIIKTENNGVSSARNLGIRQATGEYILFIDFDDTVNTNIIKECLKIIEKYNVDIIKFGGYIVSANKSKKVGYGKKCGLYNKDNLKQIKTYLHRNEINAFCCFMMIKKEIIGNTKFNTSIRYMEDYIFLCDIIEKCNSAYIANKYLYNYMQHSDSSSRSIEIGDRLKGIDLRKNIVLRNYAGDKKEIVSIISMYLKTQLYIVNNIINCKKYKYGTINEEIYKNVNKLMKEYSISLFNLNITENILLIVTKYNMSMPIASIIKCVRKIKND